MPCEACNAQFTVFKRKKSCTECRRLYCNQCLVKRKEKILCNRCVILTMRPLSKIELLKLKPKDLIFYLQSKHVSTTGCVEKEELVNLVIHINNVNGYASSSSNNNVHGTTNNGTDSDENCSNPFDQIKQTCQNLFTSFTDKIASDLNFDLKQSASNGGGGGGGGGGGNQNIFQQPRSSPRPQQQRNPVDNLSENSVPITNISSTSPSSTVGGGGRLSMASSAVTSPVNSVNSTRSQTAKISSTSNSNSNHPMVHQTKSPQPHQQPAATFCDCSDDEMINKFQENYHNKRQTSPITNNENDDPEAGPSNKNTNETSSCNKTQINTDDVSSTATSSFEELGAVGGSTISQSNDMENWQFINKTMINDDHQQITNKCDDNELELNLENSKLISFPITTTHSNEIAVNDNVITTIANHQPQSAVLSASRIAATTSTASRLLRRRSDSFIRNLSTNPLLISPDNISMDNLYNNHQDVLPSSSMQCRKKSKQCCQKCGKGKDRTLRKHVEKFKLQLESSNASDAEIREQLHAFLQYLESCNTRNSTECSDTESNDDTNSIMRRRRSSLGATIASPTMAADNIDNNGATMISMSENDVSPSSYRFGDDDGIHVYGMNDDNGGGQLFHHQTKPVICLSDYELSDLDVLSVKELKQLLMLNRVDFKGCCEKTELLERVQRLWTDTNTCPAVEKLPTDDLCKICMDAPIECVILECGHMATCTSCGKVLSECPICRQYIVRVVRFFRA